MHETFWHRINYFTARVMNLSLIGLPSLIACMKSIVSIFSKIGIYINPDVWDAGQSTFILPLAKLSHVKHISIPRIDWWLLLMLWLTSDERWWCFLTFYPQNSYVITISCGQFIRGVNVWWPGSLLVTVACVSNDAIIWSDDDRGEISGSRLHYLEAGARLSQGPSEVHWSRARWWPSGARGTHSGARAWRHGHWPGVTRHGRRQAPDGKLQQRIRFTSLSLPAFKRSNFPHWWPEWSYVTLCPWSHKVFLKHMKRRAEPCASAGAVTSEHTWNASGRGWWPLRGLMRLSSDQDSVRALPWPGVSSIISISSLSWWCGEVVQWSRISCWLDISWKSRSSPALGAPASLLWPDVGWATSEGNQKK